MQRGVISTGGFGQILKIKSNSVHSLWCHCLVNALKKELNSNFPGQQFSDFVYEQL